MTSYAQRACLFAPDPAGPAGGAPGPDPRSVSRIRVRYCECDPMGVAHHAAYIPWFEIGRTEMLRAVGKSYADLEAQGVFLVITRLDARYRRPVLYDDIVDIVTHRVGGSRVKIEHRYEVLIAERSASGVARHPLPHGPAAVGETTLACVGRDGRPMALPDWLSSASDA